MLNKIFVFVVFNVFISLNMFCSARTMESSEFVVLTDVVPDAEIEMRYCSTYNFIGEKVNGYIDPIAIVTKETALALRDVVEELKIKGYTVKIYDAYRPQMAVDHFVRWAENISDIRMKSYFYPDVCKSDLISKGYIARKSGHTKGSTVDLTLYDIHNCQDVDMGGNFDFFGYKSHPSYPYLTESQLYNRNLLRQVMIKHGFKGIDTEWWHFTLVNEPYPSTYFNFLVSYESMRNKS